MKRMFFALLLTCFVSACAHVPVVMDILTSTVTAECSLPEAINAGGYVYVNSLIFSPRFPELACKPGEVKVSLVSFDYTSAVEFIASEGLSEATLDSFNFNYTPSTDEIIAGLAREGFRPATLPELLAIRPQYSNFQEKFWVVALGSTWTYPDGSAAFPVIHGDIGGRLLTLVRDAPENAWPPAPWFAAVRK